MFTFTKMAAKSSFSTSNCHTVDVYCNISLQVKMGTGFILEPLNGDDSATHAAFFFNVLENLSINGHPWGHAS